MKIAGRAALLGMAAITVSPAIALGQAVEKVQTYAIEGQSGIDLYRSIGEKGPKVGATRAIAYTTFDLKWSRKYEPIDGGCHLVKATPHLIITYTLPKPARALPPAIGKRWKIFIDGVQRHEKVHGETIKQMVETIEAFSLGFTVPDDPKCAKIRQELTVKLAAASQAQRQQGRDFDAEEFRDGGNMHRLILGLVNE